MTMPPRNWLAAVLALTMRPQSKEPRKRLTRASPVTSFTRTSQNMAPCECMDQCWIFERHRALASATSSARPARERMAA
jgi:hypothetical protein